MTLSGGWRGRGAHDIDGTSARAREKREAKRTTRARVEQREVRGAFCPAFLVRARADSVGGGTPACTANGAPGGKGQPNGPQNWVFFDIFCPKVERRGVSSRSLNRPSKHCITQETKNS